MTNPSESPLAYGTAYAAAACGRRTSRAFCASLLPWLPWSQQRGAAAVLGGTSLASCRSSLREHMHPTLQATCGEALWPQCLTRGACSATWWCIICLAFFVANAQEAQAQAQVLFDVPRDVPAECDQTVNEVLGRLRAIRMECDGDSCTSACGIAMVPYLEQCGEVVDAILDSSATATLHAKRVRCVAEASTSGLFAQLAQRVSQGSCPEAALEGVGTTAVPTCVDSHQNCASRIAAGLATCATNFCATCDQASQCDQTCGLCTEEPFMPPTTGGGHRLQEASTCAAETFDDGAPPPRCC